MTCRINLFAGGAICAALLPFLTVTTAAAQAPPVPAPVTTTTAVKLSAPLPAGLTAEKIMDKFVQASGGKAALANVKTTIQRGTITIAGQKIKGKFEGYIKRPNRIYTVQELENIGKFEGGYDGKLAWAKDPINGLRELKGKELAQKKREISDDANKSEWRATYKNAEALGIRKVEGKDAYAVRLTPAAVGGKPAVWYFDPKTGLLIRMDMINESDQGTIPIQMHFSDYRTISGQKIPFLIRQKAGPAEVTITLTEVKINEPIPDSKFIKPPSANSP